jgi:hypothetical protein
MNYVGRAVLSFSSLSWGQRCVVSTVIWQSCEGMLIVMKHSNSLWTPILAVYAAGMSHEDLRVHNIAMAPTGAVYLLDFSHRRHHNCSSEEECSELILAKEMLG